MSLDISIATPPTGERVSGRPRAVIVTSYMTGAPKGRNVGVPGYSYDLVVQLYAPLLQSWGEVAVVPREAVDSAVETARRRGFEPIHVSFLPFQDVRLARNAPNVVVPAWEFPDVPNFEFDGNPQNNWVATAARCNLVVVGGAFTATAFRRSGIKTPLRMVPVPTPDEYFQLPAWAPDRAAELHCRTADFTDYLRQCRPTAGRSSAVLSRVARRVKNRYGAIANRVRSQLVRWRLRPANPLSDLPGDPDKSARLSGVVYTSIFNPIDGRKNWTDLITGFVCALKDCDDATLLLKLITNQPEQVQRVWTFYEHLGIPHRCRVVVVADFLDDRQLLDLVRPTTFYITTTRAEGNCLPLMNYLAAGRPSISPCHTAIADYFGRDVGFVVDSHPEPTAFPHDSELRRTTTWHRLVWTSLVEQIRNSYAMAKQDYPAYQSLAENARWKMLGWCHPGQVGPRLHEALDLVAPSQNERRRTEKPDHERKAA